MTVAHSETIHSAWLMLDRETYVLRPVLLPIMAAR